VKYHFKELA